MFDPVAQIDILGLSTLLGSLVLFAGLAWLLISNRSLEELNEIHDRERERARPGRQTPVEATGPDRITLSAGAEALPKPQPEPGRVTVAAGPEAVPRPEPEPGKPTRPGRPTRPARTRRAA